jgi:hypothetical protein
MDANHFAHLSSVRILSQNFSSTWSGDNKWHRAERQPSWLQFNGTDVMTMAHGVDVRDRLNHG